MILNHHNDSFPRVCNMTLFWRINNNFNMTSFSTSVERFCKISIRPSGLLWGNMFRYLLGDISGRFYQFFKISIFCPVLSSERCILCHFLAFLPTSQGDRDGQIWVILGLWLLCRDISRCMLNCVTIFIFRFMGGHWIQASHMSFNPL